MENKLLVRLAGIPKPFVNESLSSWIQRVCQVYDLTFERFHELFSTLGGADADLCLTSDQLSYLAKVCGLHIADFYLIEKSFCRIVRRPNLQKLLLSGSVDGYTYRFCPHCLAEDRIPYFRFEWRFRHYEYCLTHQTELRAQCDSCGKAIPMHRAQLGGTYHPPPTSNLATCLYCRSDLRRAHHIDTKKSNNLAEKLDWQKAVISAVLNDYFYIAPVPEKFCLEQLANLLDGFGLETPANNINTDVFETGCLEIQRRRIKAAENIKSFVPFKRKCPMWAQSSYRTLIYSAYPLPTKLQRPENVDIMPRLEI